MTKVIFGLISQWIDQIVEDKMRENGHLLENSTKEACYRIGLRHGASELHSTLKLHDIIEIDYGVKGIFPDPIIVQGTVVKVGKEYLEIKCDDEKIKSHYFIDKGHIPIPKDGFSSLVGKRIQWKSTLITL